MAAITKTTRHVFRAPTKGRDYLTVTAAAKAEARALMDERYPPVRAEYDGDGRCTFGGLHWSGDQRLVRVHARLARLILRAFRQKQGAPCSA
ncbi:hypothetical protein N5C96_29210 [Delftia tsuruhatensis]|uniref:hypothetical protein n=1 Tax=Delftia tsuruhatensis TaxID=180282 RepID=UPI00244BB9F6|nr:hypothetical protein [Delftia tsuruhatensis]MDH0777498.1 hypothetical protein [Delftia tsuruhatensis]MDH1824655.1 hypothetical protein [Delftia tsuruhatensis]